MIISRAEIETALGGVQLRAMERAVSLAAGVRRERAGDIAYSARPGKPSGGAPLVCVHGFGGDKETWLMMSAFVPRGRAIAMIDLPGHGASAEVEEDRATIRHHAEAALRVMDRCGIDRGVICGNSMGGGVALRLARSWPDRVAAMVLCASVGRDVHTNARAWAVEGGTNPLIPRPEDIDKFMALVLERPPPVGRAVIRHVIVARTRRAASLEKLFRGFVAGDGEAGVPRELGEIRQPALVLHGDQDRIIDRAVAEDLVAGLPRAELVIMRGIGHAPQLEAPRAVAKMIAKFVDRVL